MLVFRHHNDLPESVRGSVLAIGNFDGIHKGHQALSVNGTPANQAINSYRTMLIFRRAEGVLCEVR